MTTNTLRQAGQVLAEARHYGLRDLSADVLARMLRECEEARDEIAGQIAQDGEHFERSRRAGRWSEMEQVRERILLLQEDLREVESEADRIADTYQEVLLRERLIERLGSASVLSALEGLILLLIGAVLVILWIEMTTILTEGQELAMAAVDTAICGVFLWEFFWRMKFADSKRWYWRRYWIDFVASLPLGGLLRVGRIARVARAARAARIARLARAARVVRALRALAFFSRGFDKIAAIFRLQVFTRPLALTLALLVAGGLAISHIEGTRAPEVAGFSKGIWWSFTTVVTGGFGDIYNPRSPYGQMLTVLLVILGIILTGALTAGLASILLGDDNVRIERKQSAIHDRLGELSERVERIEALLAAPGRERGTDDGGSD